MKKSERKLPSLRGRLLLLSVVCWIVPILIILGFISISYRDKIIHKTDTILEDELHNFSAFISLKINEAITTSQQISYEPDCEGAWRSYQQGDIDSAALYKTISASLRMKFMYDNQFELAAFYLYGEETPFWYGSRQGLAQSEFMDEVHEAAYEFMQLDSSWPEVRILNGRIFVFRNVYTTTNYTKFGSLVLELNPQNLVSDFAIGDEYEVAVFINTNEEVLSAKESIFDPKTEPVIEYLAANYEGTDRQTWYKTHAGGYLGYMYEEMYPFYNMGVVMIVDDDVLFGQIKQLYILVFWILLAVIPFLAYQMHFMREQLSRPVQFLVKAVKKFEDGQLGQTIDSEDIPNSEFQYLTDTFNQMSVKVKKLFDFAYDEQIAGRDAKIMALQAQINPHFLNNTLEMMNWQARMTNDPTLCKMIEALGTVMDYRMDRGNQRLISLAEELRCADAYLYIISMRFGQRLQVDREIDESLLQIQIPRLILQPILENAVTHGIEMARSGMIKIKIDHDDAVVSIRVINSGREMSQEDQERVDNILRGEPIMGGQGKHISLGIRNVHERVRLIFGEEYGLTIHSLTDGRTESLITIPYGKEENSDKDRVAAEKRLKKIIDL